ncbi:hypothetical protein H6F61_21160 [Cyanobacteria bacterium FACHB-472]|nr:hypothetical protein [Cyanobacteria bacterium FACHB-472]
MRRAITLSPNKRNRVFQIAFAIHRYLVQKPGFSLHAIASPLKSDRFSGFRS